MTNLPVPQLQVMEDGWRESFRKACNLIAPVWPLDQWIAVNPFWGLRHSTAAEADRLLHERGGISLLMPLEYYREAWEGGRIREEDLRASIEEFGNERCLSDYLAWPGHPNTSAPAQGSIPGTFPGGSENFADNSEESLAEVVCDQVSKTCGAFFDQRQGRWPATRGECDTGLFGFWLESVREDRSLDFRTGLAGARAFFNTVPDTMDEAIEESIKAIRVSGQELEALFHSLLLRVNGWASWCRGEDWRAGLEGASSDRCAELLAIMLVWESLGAGFASPTQKAQWQEHRAWARRAGDRNRLWVWQRAFELGYQRALWQALGSGRAGCGSKRRDAASPGRLLYRCAV